MHVSVSVPPKVPITPPPTVPALKDVNDVPLHPKLLTQAPSDLSERPYCSFRCQVRLVVHGEAVMALHPAFSHPRAPKTSTTSYRSFVSEYCALGFPDADQRLRTYIAETTRKFGLGADWMNDHADVALPWALECVMTPDL